MYVIIQKPFSYNYFILIAVSKKLVKILGLTVMLRGFGPLQHPKTPPLTPPNMAFDRAKCTLPRL